MAKFITTTPIKFSATEITPEGSEVELTEKEARPLLKSAEIVRAKDTAPPPDTKTGTGGQTPTP